MLKEKWQKMSLAQQMGNVGSAVIRALHFEDKTNEAGKERLEEALNLFDLTISDKRWQFRVKEILKMRSVFCDTFFELGNFKVSAKSIEQYFIPFAIKANSER